MEALLPNACRGAFSFLSVQSLPFSFSFSVSSRSLCSQSGEILKLVPELFFAHLDFIQQRSFSNPSTLCFSVDREPCVRAGELDSPCGQMASISNAADRCSCPIDAMTMLPLPLLIRPRAQTREARSVGFFAWPLQPNSRQANQTLFIFFVIMPCSYDHQLCTIICPLYYMSAVRILPSESFSLSSNRGSQVVRFRLPLPGDVCTRPTPLCCFFPFGRPLPEPAVLPPRIDRRRRHVRRPFQSLPCQALLAAAHGTKLLQHSKTE